jgi:hypothetical protein
MNRAMDILKKSAKLTLLALIWLANPQPHGRNNP